MIFFFLMFMWQEFCQFIEFFIQECFQGKLDKFYFDEDDKCQILLVIYWWEVWLVDVVWWVGQLQLVIYMFKLIYFDVCGSNLYSLL